MIVSERTEVLSVQTYEVTRCVPGDLSESELEACAEIITAGEAVDPEWARAQLPLAISIAVARLAGEIVGIGAIKQVRPGYATSIAGRSKFAFRSDTPELGYVAVTERHRRQGLSHRLVEKLLASHQGPLFATTDNANMKASLLAGGFSQKGHEWMGQRAMLSLWIRD
jgi:GNAT superfamily N-acetyltransferase